MLTFGSLFSGIGGSYNDSSKVNALLNSQEFVNGKQLKVSQSMTIGTQDNTILDRVFTTITFTDNMMGIADGFTPTTSHTFIRIQTAHGLIPGPFVGIKFLTTKDIRHALVPGYTRAKPVDNAGGGGSLLPGFVFILVVSYVSPLPTLFVKPWAKLAAATSTFNGIHYLLSLIRRYCILYHYPAMRAKRC